MNSTENSAMQTPAESPIAAFDQAAALGRTGASSATRTPTTDETPIMSTQIASSTRVPSPPRRGQLLSLAVLAAAAFLLLAGPAAAAGPAWAITSSVYPTGFAPGNEEQALTVDATGGTFTVTFGGQTTPAIQWNAPASTVQADLNGLSTIGGVSGSVTVTGGPGDGAGSSPYYVTFTGSLAATDVPQMSADGSSLTGSAATATVATVANGGTVGTYAITATNVGDAATDGSTITIADVLPPALTATVIRGVDAGSASALTCDLTTLTCSDPLLSVAPGNALHVEVTASLAGAAPPTLPNTASVSGGGAASASFTEPTTVSSSPAGFGIESFSAHVNNADGSLATQAGGHPYSAATNFVVNTVPAGGGGVNTAQDLKDLALDLPPGFIGNPQAVPQCTLLAGCGPANQVGTTTASLTFGGPGGLTQDIYTAPVYNLIPPHGVAAAFGFVLPASKNVDITIMARLRAGGDYGVTTVVSDLSQAEQILSTTLTLWGVPGDPSHDAQRGLNCQSFPRNPGGDQCVGGGEPFPGVVDAFLTNPTFCGSPLPTTLSVDSWQNPGVFVSPPPAFSPAPTDCGFVAFTPAISVQPTSSAADSPTGLDVNLSVPSDGLLNPTGIAQSQLRDATVTLPPGMTVSPSAADGLQGCSDAQIAVTSADPGSCPAASQIGTATIDTPLLDHPLQGDVYLGTPLCGPCTGADAADGRMLRLFIQVDDPLTGIVVKLPGTVSADPQTGQLTATFKDNPQLPFDDLKLQFKSGPRAPVANPITCGTYMTTTDLAPWSAPFTPDATPSSSFEINGCGNPNQFSPSFTAGTTNPVAGAYAPFVLSFSRSDADQELSGLSVTLPPGLLAKLAGVPLCSDANANAGTCPAASQVGTVETGAGLGSQPFFLPGKAYLTGPYKGGPYGLAVVVPAIAGPFNLGTVVVRQSLRIDPTDAHVTAMSDPFPTILDGIPLRIRRVDVNLDRPGFMFNPTNCNPLAINGTLTSTQGASAAVSSRFQAANCASLPFKPSLTASTEGKTSKANGASLKVKIASAGIGQAGIAKVDLTIPTILPSRLTTLQKACTEAQFNANPAGCPSASLIATATVHTPLLSSPLSGPVYFVSHGGAAFPDTEIILQGEGVTLILDGHTQIKKGVTYSLFESVPDAPFTSFEFNAPEGPHSIFGANGNLCQTEVRMPTTLVAQNGAVINQQTLVEPEGCPNKLTILSRTVKKRTLTLKVAVPGAGRLSATGKGLSGASKSAKGRSIVTLTLRAKGHAKHKMKVKLTFAPSKGRKLTAAVVARFRR